MKMPQGILNDESRRCLHGLPQPLACGACFSYYKIEDRDMSQVSFYTQADRGTHMHMLCSLESVQETIAHVEGLGNKDECGQGACFGKDHNHNTN